MKLKKFLFNRTTITILYVLIQLAVFITLGYYLTNKFVYVLTAIRVFCYIIVLFIFVLDMSPTYKLPWIILLLVFPVVGGVLFITFGNERISKKMVRHFKEEEGKSRLFLDELGISLNNCQSKYKEQATYLNTTSNVPVYQNTKTEYLNDGKVYFDKLMNTLREAKKFIFMEYFIISEGTLWQEVFSILKEKAKNGVKVYVLYDDIGSSASLPYKLKKLLKKNNIQCEAFNHLIPVASALQEHRDHRKIVVVDNHYAITGGINLADEYANLETRFGYWKDAGLYLEGDAVNTFTVLFIQMWNVSNKIKLEYSDFTSTYIYKEGNDGFVMPFGDGPSPFDKDHIGEETLINMINMSCKYIYLTTPYLVMDYHLMQMLKIAAKKKIDVRIITPHIPDKKIINLMTRNSYLSLIESGVKIYEYTPGFIHEKNWISDDNVAMVGTINLDYRSLIHHFECGVWLSDTDTIKDIKADFLKTLDESQEITKEKAKLKVWEKIIRNIISLFSALL